MRRGPWGLAGRNWCRGWLLDRSSRMDASDHGGPQHRLL